MSNMSNQQAEYHSMSTSGTQNASMPITLPISCWESGRLALARARVSKALNVVDASPGTVTPHGGDSADFARYSAWSAAAKLEKWVQNVAIGTPSS